MDLIPNFAKSPVYAFQVYGRLKKYHEVADSPHLEPRARKDLYISKRSSKHVRCEAGYGMPTSRFSRIINEPEYRLELIKVMEDWLETSGPKKYMLRHKAGEFYDEFQPQIATNNVPTLVQLATLAMMKPEFVRKFKKIAIVRSNLTPELKKEIRQRLDKISLSPIQFFRRISYTRAYRAYHAKKLADPKEMIKSNHVENLRVNVAAGVGNYQLRQLLNLGLCLDRIDCITVLYARAGVDIKYIDDGLAEAVPAVAAKGAIECLKWLFETIAINQIMIRECFTRAMETGQLGIGFWLLPKVIREDNFEKACYERVIVAGQVGSFDYLQRRWPRPISSELFAAAIESSLLPMVVATCGHLEDRDLSHHIEMAVELGYEEIAYFLFEATSAPIRWGDLIELAIICCDIEMIEFLKTKTDSYTIRKRPRYIKNRTIAYLIFDDLLRRKRYDILMKYFSNYYFYAYDPEEERTNWRVFGWFFKWNNDRQAFSDKEFIMRNIEWMHEGEFDVIIKHMPWILERKDEMIEYIKVRHDVSDPRRGCGCAMIDYLNGGHLEDSDGDGGDY